MNKITFKSSLIILALSLLFGSNLSAQTQVGNSNFETWDSLGEEEEIPANWNNMMNGDLDPIAAIGKTQTVWQSEDTRPGSSGDYSAEIKSKFFIIALVNGTMTVGRMHAPSMDPDDGFTKTHTGDSEFNQPFTAKPDSLAVWVKYSETTDIDSARVSAILHKDYDYTDPEQDSTDANQVVAKAVQNFQTNGDWMRLSIPFDYEDESSDDPAYILLTFTSSKTPGEGEDQATLWVDDLEMIYNTSVSIVPNEEQNININEEGIELTAEEDEAGYGSAESRVWKFREEGEETYQIIEDETESVYTPYFEETGTYYVIVESTFGETVSTSDEVKINVEEEADPFYFTHIQTEGATTNIDFEMEGPEEGNFGDYSDQQIEMDPDEVDPNDINFTATFSEDAYIKMWIDLTVIGIEDFMEVVSSEGVVSSPYIGTSELLGMLNLAPEGTYDFYIAGSTTGEPSFEADPDNDQTEVIKITLKIEKDLSVDTPEFEHLNIYPNPVESNLHIENSLPVEQVDIYTMNAQHVKTFNPNSADSQLDVSELNTGIYLLKITVDGKQFDYKLIKK